MNKGLASLIQVLGTTALGYQKGKAAQEDREEARKDREIDRAYQTETRDRQKQEWERQDAVRGAIKDGQSDVAIEEIPGQTDYNIESMGGVGVPANGIKPPAAGYKVAGQTFSDRSLAEQAAQGLNTKLGKAKRTAEGLAPLDPEQASKYEAHMKQMIAEGTVEALDAISQRAPAPDVVKKAGGKVASTIGQELADRFNATGKWKVSPDTMVEYFTTKNAAGQDVTNARVIGKDGKPVVEDVQGAFRTLLSVKERMAADSDESRTFLTAKQQAEQARHNGAVERQTAEDNRAQRSIQQQGIGLQRERLNMEKNSFKKQTVEGQLETIEKTLGPLDAPTRKKYAESLLGLSKGKDVDSGLITDLTKKFQDSYQTNNPTATPTQVATATAQYRQAQEQRFGAIKANGQVETTVRNVFAKLKPGTPEYAEAYSDAQTEAGMTEQKLSELGIKPPTERSGAASVAATAGVGASQARIPNPPTERAWVGNKFVVTPAYTEWEQKYGAEYRRRNEAAQQRMIGALERVRN